jgi:hypothetical protein
MYMQTFEASNLERRSSYNRENPPQRLREEDFIGTYQEKSVREDLEYVARRKREHETYGTLQRQEQKEVATMFEEEVLLNTKYAGWMGKDATAVQASEYDDFHNGVDMIVEWREGNSQSHLGLAADVTFSSDRSVIANKFAILRDQINRGTLAEVKYYQSSTTGRRGPLFKLPEVVIGVSEAKVLELKRLRKEKQMRALAEHKAGILILIQIEAQLEVFARYAREVDQPSPARIYSERLKIIRGILEETREAVAKIKNGQETDPVHLEIMDFMKNWSRY